MTAKLTINQAHLTVESGDDQKKEIVIVESEHGLTPGTVLEVNDVTDKAYDFEITDKNSEVK